MREILCCNHLVSQLPETVGGGQLSKKKKSETVGGGQLSEKNTVSYMGDLLDNKLNNSAYFVVATG